MTKWVDYAQAQTAYDSAHSAMLASQLTYTIVQTRLREAAMEEATDQVAYLEERAETLAPLVDHRAHEVAELTAEAEQRRVRATTDDLGTMLAVLTALTGMLERLRIPHEQFASERAAAAMLAERVEQYANTLPKEQWRLRVAANELTLHVRTMQEHSQHLAPPCAMDHPTDCQ